MFMYSIDKDIPPPADNNHSGRKVYPFAEMQPGDSVFIDGGRSDGKECAAAYAIAHSRRKKGINCRFKARNENGGVRIWRVK